MDELDKPIKVYVKRDKDGNIVDVNSEIFITDLDGWEYYDEGYGDRYAHAQSQYFGDEIFENLAKKDS